MLESELEPLYFADKVPILQNKVYPDAESAKQCPSGSLNIVMERETGLYINANFDASLMMYDRDYDNSVPSNIFMNYYDEIADYLLANYGLNEGTILDIGCGKGLFISRMASKYDSLTALGIDPSYEGPKTICDGRVRFINEYFTQQHISKDTKVSIVLCRHTLEHVPSPASFLRTIFEPFSLHEFEDIPVFIEVPDIDWITANDAFWDFCYEHVNYFSHKSLYQCITQAGGQVNAITPGFNGQYIWAEAVLNPSGHKSEQANKYVDEARPRETEKPGKVFKTYIASVAERVGALSQEKPLVIWGMATKGVMYSLLLGSAGISADYCVDINERKQGKYSPLSGNRIASPTELKSSEKYAVICMNPNYVSEIKAQCIELGLDAMLYSPDGTELERK